MWPPSSVTMLWPHTMRSARFARSATLFTASAASASRDGKDGTSTAVGHWLRGADLVDPWSDGPTAAAAGSAATLTALLLPPAARLVELLRHCGGALEDNVRRAAAAVGPGGPFQASARDASGGKSFLRSDFCSLPLRRAEARLGRAEDEA